MHFIAHTPGWPGWLFCDFRVWAEVRRTQAACKCRSVMMLRLFDFTRPQWQPQLWATWCHILPPAACCLPPVVEESCKSLNWILNYCAHEAAILMHTFSGHGSPKCLDNISVFLQIVKWPPESHDNFVSPIFLGIKEIQSGPGWFMWTCARQILICSSIKCFSWQAGKTSRIPWATGFGRVGYWNPADSWAQEQAAQHSFSGSQRCVWAISQPVSDSVSYRYLNFLCFV